MPPRCLYFLCPLQGVAFSTIGIATALQFVHSPFWDRRVDLLDCVCCVVVMLHVLSGLLYINPDFKDFSSIDELEHSLLVVNGGAILIIFGLFVLGVFEDKIWKVSATKSVARVVAELVVTLQRSLHMRQELFLQALLELSSAETVQLEPFKQAVEKCLHGIKLPKPSVIEALFLVLQHVDSKDCQASGAASGVSQKMVCVCHVFY